MAFTDGAMPLPRGKALPELLLLLLNPVAMPAEQLLLVSLAGKALEHIQVGEHRLAHLVWAPEAAVAGGGNRALMKMP